jgi:hypothetical protein
MVPGRRVDLSGKGGDVKIILNIDRQGVAHGAWGLGSGFGILSIQMVQMDYSLFRPIIFAQQLLGGKGTVQWK